MKVFLILFVLPALATASTYRPVANQKAPIKFTLPYSTGTHEGEASVVTGSTDLSKAEFHVPISSIKCGGEKQTCHLQESLGLDYTKSNYPGDHVCEDGKLPASGKNAVVFSEIVFKAASMKPVGADQMELEGTWTIHGITKPSKFTVKLIHEGKNLRVQGEIPFSLKNYGVEVKSAHILFVTISVEDEAKVALDLLLEPI